MSENTIPIPARLKNVSVGGHVAGVEDIMDDALNKTQKQINTEVSENLGTGGSVDQRIASAVNTEKGLREAADTALDGRVDDLETAVGTGGSVDTRISSAVSAETTRAQAAESALGNRITGLTQSDIVVVEDHEQVQDPDATTIYREFGESSYADWMSQDGGNTWQKMAQYDNAIDDEPTAGSDNLVKSGGVYANIPPKDFHIQIQVGVNYVINGSNCTITFEQYNTNYSVGYIDFNKEVNERYLYGDAGHDDNGKLVYQLANFQYLVGRLQGAIGTNYILTIVNYNQLEKTDVLLACVAYGKIYGKIADVVDKEVIQRDVTNLKTKASLVEEGISYLNKGIEINKCIQVNDIVEREGWYLTPYIDVDGLDGVIYAARKHQTTGPYATITCYDANKEYITDWWWTTDDIRTIMFENENVKYIRCSMNLERIAETYIARLDGIVLWSPWQYDVTSILPKDFVTVIQFGLDYVFNGTDCTISIGYVESSGTYSVGYIDFDGIIGERYIKGKQEDVSNNKLVYILHNFQYLVARLTGAIGSNYILTVTDYDKLRSTDIMIAYVAYSRIYGIAYEMSERGNMAKLEDNILIPSYYDNYLQTIESKIEDKIIELGERNDSFFFFTDIHTLANAKNSGRIIGELMKRTNINKAVFGGDIAPAYGNRGNLLQTMKDYTENWYRFISPYGKLFSVQGNHDFSIRTSSEDTSGMTLPLNAIRNYFMSRQSDEAILHYDDNNPESIYFYMDNQSQKIRFIFINTTDSIAGTDISWGVRATFSKTQSDWCYNAINTAPNGYGIVVIGHIPACETNEPAIQTLADFLGGFKNKQSVTVNSTTYNFTNVGSELICMIAGHEHRDDYVLYKNVPYFITTCDAGYGVVAGQFTELADYPAKTFGTIYEQTFDSVFIDIENKLIDYIRIGGGYDRRCHFDVKQVGIGNSIQLQTSIQNAEWLACDGTGNHYQYIPGQGDVYENVLTKISINNGTVTGLVAGNAVVGARNRTTLQLEVFCIEVI